MPHQPRLFLIDSFGFIFRAYHARARTAAPPMRTSAGLSTEAVYIFNNMLRKLAKSYAPEYIAAVFESGAPVARMAEFAEYKANRTEMPPDLGEQIPHIRRILEAMRIPILGYAGFEADDVIGAIARRAEQAGIEVVIVSSDKDMMQIVSERVSMLNPAKDDEWYGPEKVKEFLSVLVGTVLLSPLFLIMRGKGVSVPRGTNVIAYVDGDPDIALPAAGVAQAGPSVQMVAVSFNSNPDGADVIIDGKYATSTPSTLQLAAGNHNVAIEKSAFKAWQRTIIVTAGSSITMSATLEK